VSLRRRSPVPHQDLFASNRVEGRLYVGMPAWLVGVLAAVLVILTTWALLVVAARRLPPGLLRDLAAILPACVTAARRLRRDARVPRRAKLVVALAGLWVLSPIDLVPEFLPIIGPLDDVVVVALALRYAARRVPTELLFEAWPAEPRLLERLLGRRWGGGPAGPPGGCRGAECGPGG
jgi:uncharacterized membrane protein YkvA (DUF1232 family)